ncbi:duodenase-1-like [Melanotaenia boesemani]|uniref:duodenase-1-like n=1 Tax=Melanotaenia boesemani TaxID=1250792 RepID=UPI001C04C33E|nr:duodenase-1-like [Melanotaenia boesemani]
MNSLRTFLLLHVLTCVGQTVNGSDIIHGEKAPKNSMPYMVSVQNHHGHMCGGFLITQGFVVTAAHCGENILTHVILGTNKIMEDNYLKRGIEKSYIHPGYTSPGFGFDIMLLKLSVEVDINERIHTIKIPASKMNVKENQTCSVAGWGMTQTAGSVVNELRVVNVLIIDPESCKEEWTALPPNVICAGGSGTDKGFCQGDSGGPLVCNDIAVGIVSFNKNSNCNYPDVPNVYTDISEYVPWINEIVKENYYHM